MKNISVVALLVLVLGVLAEGQPNGPKPKQVKCNDKNYPYCYHLKKVCPDNCPRSCDVDCVSCQPVCIPSPSLSPPPPPPADFPVPPTLTPPSSNSTQTPPPANPPPSIPPPTWTPPPEVSGKRVYCKNRNFPQCYRMEHRCPSACPDQCEVDCVTCSPVCSKFLIYFFSTLYNFLTV